MTIRHLQIFKCACECASFTAAAQRLNITQPSVSLAIAELEAFYNTKLFDRLNRKIYLTSAGETLRGYADSLLGQFDEATAVLRDGGVLKQCSLGINVSAAEAYLAEIVKRTKTYLPQLQLNICVQNNEQLDRLLTDNQIDFAIFDGVTDSRVRSSFALFKDKMSVVCAPTYFSQESITLGQLAKKPLLLREIGSGMRSCVDALFLRGGYTVKSAAESISTLCLIDMAKAGLGFAIIPGAAAEKFCTESLKTVHLTDGELLRYYYLVHNTKKHLSAGMLEFEELIKGMFDEYPNINLQGA